jgi:transcriptional regulator with XRE-family HTH domain
VTTSENVSPVGARVRALRQRKVLTQAELAERASISADTLVHIETGQSTPRPATIRKLARALGVSASALVAPEIAP